MWSHWICDSITGTKLMRVHPSSDRWRTVVNAVGDGEHTFQLRDAQTALPRDTWRDLSRPWARTVVTCWDDVPQYAGLIQTWNYTRGSGALTLNTVELRAIFSKRMPFVVPAYTPGSAFTVTGKSLRGLVRAIVFAGTFSGYAGDDWYFPVEFPGDESGPHTESWLQHKFVTIENMLTQIQDTDGGPDVYLQPKWASNGTLAWLLRIGTPALSGPTFEWDLTAERSDVLDFTVNGDGSKQLTGVFAVSEGAGEDMIVGRTPAEGLPGSRIPNRDEKRPFKMLTSQADADARAKSELRSFREATEFQEFNVMAGATLPSMVLGSTLRTWDEDDVFNYDGWATRALVGMSGDLSEKIGLELL